MVSTLYMTIATYMVHHAPFSDFSILLCCYEIKWHKKVYTTVKSAAGMLYCKISNVGYT